MKTSDTAMYRSKELGRNTYQFYTRKTDAHLFGRITMESMLRRAIENDEIEVYYQPRVHIESQKIVGVEALARWKHPSIGMIKPKDFIPLAEETGLIIPLGQQLLRQTCKRMKSWQAKGLPAISVSVNLSARQFHQQHLANSIAEILTETGLDPAFLELEITESSTMKNVDFTEFMLTELKKMGLRILIDDFGTGYSSLFYLKQFPIDGLKIDRSFVSSIENASEDDQAIVSAIIALAQTLKLEIIAEGVETMGQLSFLKRQKCTQVQGFLFGRPISGHQMEKRLVSDLFLPEVAEGI